MNPSALAAKAEKKFGQYGQVMTFVQEIESGQPDVSTGLPSVVQKRTDFRGMWDTVQLNEIGSLIQVGDAVIWAGGSSIPAPDITDWIEVDGKAWDIINVEPTKPGSVAILYKLYVRAAGSAYGYSRKGA